MNTLTYPTIIRPATNRAPVEVCSAKEHFETLLREVTVVSGVKSDKDYVVMDTDAGYIRTRFRLKDGEPDVVSVQWTTESGEPLSPLFNKVAIRDMESVHNKHMQPTMLPGVVADGIQAAADVVNYLHATH